MYKDRYRTYLNDDSSINNDDVPKRTLAAIPCYNTAKTIGSVVLKAKQYVDEVIVIDDGSTDDTVNIAKIAGATVLTHGGNKGYGAAIQSCFKYARNNDYDVMTILDGDGQHDADQIQTVMKPVIQKEADISIGSRFLDETSRKVPRYRRFGIWLLTRFTNAGSKKEYHHRITDGQSGFRAYSRKAIETIHPKDSDMGVSAEILMQGHKQNLLYKEVPISVDYDLKGSTKKPVRHGIGVIVSILKYMEVQHALLFFGVPGLILFVAGLFTGTSLYVHYIDTGGFPLGWAILTIIFLVLGMLLGITALILHAVLNAAHRRFG